MSWPSLRQDCAITDTRMWHAADTSVFNVVQSWSCPICHVQHYAIHSSLKRRLFAQYTSQHGSHAVWYGVVQPGDALYTPASAVVLEYLTGPALGYKWHVVPPSLGTATQLNAIANHMVSLGKTASLPVVQAAKVYAEAFVAHKARKTNE
eukprot:6171109-Amphidinium_carterae.1